MKYSQTARSLSVVFHGIIALAFGCLGLYFGFFVVPEFFNPVVKDQFTLYLFTGSYLLYFELAVIGLSMFLVSTYGLVKGCLSITKKSDEELVKSFSAFISEGWIISIFFLLQGALLFDLTTQRESGSNPAFVVVAGIILAIIFLIATNIPMVKLFDGKDSSILVTRLAWGFGTTLIVMGLLALCSLPGLYVASATAADGDYQLQLWLLVLAGLVPGGLLTFLGFYARKTGKNTGVVSTGVIGASGLIIGVCMLIVGVLEVVGISDDDSFHTLLTTTGKPVGYGYPVMLIILGALVAIATLDVVAYSLKPKADKVQTRA